jgi:cytochrome d ubiquinol oxidase subunit II
VTILLRRAIIFFILSLAIVTLYTLIYIPHLTDDFKQSPVLFILPLLAFLSIANIPRLVRKRRYTQAFIFSSLSMAFLLMVVAFELYPTIILSTLDESYSLTVHNASSSDKSLGIMLLFAAIGAPLVLLYTGFVFYTFRGKVQLDETSY